MGDLQKEVYWALRERASATMSSLSRAFTPTRHAYGNEHGSGGATSQAGSRSTKVEGVLRGKTEQHSGIPGAIANEENVQAVKMTVSPPSPESEEANNVLDKNSGLDPGAGRQDTARGNHGAISNDLTVGDDEIIMKLEKVFDDQFLETFNSHWEKHLATLNEQTMQNALAGLPSATANAQSLGVNDATATGALSSSTRQPQPQPPPPPPTTTQAQTTALQSHDLLQHSAFEDLEQQMQRLQGANEELMRELEQIRAEMQAIITSKSPSILEHCAQHRIDTPAETSHLQFTPARITTTAKQSR